ncbi:hypothetical protein BJY04DRAFT_176333 [Aspergillus karnatakaensis]|uniref:pantoate--beta-alanine ligase PAN6 n=1 Tax=Aspergillus karnatakaensis TaxID=1810916 RepID=UPI003CCDF566
MFRSPRQLAIASSLFRKPSTISSLRHYSFQVFRDVPPLRKYRREILLSQRTVGLVPTMGALHEGHLSLIREAAAENSDVFVSIFVNPTQFGVNEDLSSYPRTWDADMAKLEQLNTELRATDDSGQIVAILAPTAQTMYPTLPPSSEIDGDGSFVTITPVSKKLEGASRPVFFRGVATVCMKLFNIVQAERVYFGQKDVQQTVVIRRMVEDFHLDTQVRIIPTMREEDELAMSSRNVYLGARRRAVGLTLIKALRAAESAYFYGHFGRKELLDAANKITEDVLAKQKSLPPSQRALFEVDYISLADVDSLDELEKVNPVKGAVLSGAIKMAPLEKTNSGEDCGLGDGKVPVRLIDNLVLKPKHWGGKAFETK